MITTRRASAGLAALLTCATAITAAAAQGDAGNVPAPEEDQTAAAKAAFERGVELVGAEDFPSALAAFEESYALAPRPVTLFNIAMCQKGMFRYVDALATFDRFVAASNDEEHGELREKTRAAVAELVDLVGKISFEGAPDGTAILVDGKSVATTPLASTLPLDPGPHALELRADGHEPFELELTVATGAAVVVPVALRPLAAAAPGDADEYAEILAEAEQAKVAEAERAERLEQDWARVEQIARDVGLDAEQRIAVLTHFIKTYPDDNPHEQTARGWRRELREGDEVEDYLPPEYLRTKTEWVALRIGGGNYGGQGMLSLFTLRFDLFFWDILRASGGGGVLEENREEDRRWIASGGTAVGIPWHIEDEGRFEIRFGLGVMIGWIDNEESEELLGLLLVPEGVLVWHALEYLALQAGIDLQLATVDFKGGGSAFRDPALGAFIGIRI